MRIKLTFIIILCVLVAVGSAAVAKKLSLEFLVKNATIIVQGTVKSTEAAWDKDNKEIWTEVKIEVSETFKGDKAETVSVFAHGGTVGEKAQEVAGSASFKAGEKVIVFGWKDSNGRMQILGMAQGKFILYFAKDDLEYAKNSVSGMTLVDDDGKKLKEDESKPTEMKLSDFTQAIKDFVAKEKEENSKETSE